MHDFFVLRQSGADDIGRERGIPGHGRDGAGIRPFADAPDVQVQDAGFAKLLDRFVDFIDDRVIHFPIQQHFARIDDQSLRPGRDQHRAHDAHCRIEPIPTVKPSARQRDDGQHRGGRVRDDVKVSRFYVEVLGRFVSVRVAVAVFMVVCVPVAVSMRFAENQRADEVDGQAKGGDQHGFAVLDGLRRNDALDRTGDHHRRDAEQKQGAGEARQYLDFPGAERKARIARITPRRRIGHGGESDGQRVRTHVPAVGQQRH